MVHYRVTWTNEKGEAKSLELRTWHQTRETCRTLVHMGARNVTAHTFAETRFNELSISFRKS